jgi:hypothetical protein
MAEYTVNEGDIIHFPDGTKMAVRSQSVLTRIPRDLGAELAATPPGPLGEGIGQRTKSR